MRKQKGMSIMELAIYIVSVAIIIGVAWPKITNYTEKGNQAKAISDISLLSSAISQYHQQMGAYPVNLEALTAASPYGNVPWILKLPLADPWGTTNAGIDGGGGNSAYAYSYNATGFAVWSLGKSKTNNSGGSGTVIPASFGGDDVGQFGQ